MRIRDLNGGVRSSKNVKIRENQKNVCKNIIFADIFSKFTRKSQPRSAFDEIRLEFKAF